MFCHFADGLGEKMYDRVTSMDRLRHTLEEALREYNETFAAMNLVLFEDAMRHVCRIARIILNPSGHALLVGVGGSGKQSLSRLAAHICGYRVYQITISGSYGISDLKYVPSRPSALYFNFSLPVSLSASLNHPAL